MSSTTRLPKLRDRSCGNEANSFAVVVSRPAGLRYEITRVGAGLLVHCGALGVRHALQTINQCGPNSATRAAVGVASPGSFKARLLEACRRFALLRAPVSDTCAQV